MTVKEIIIKHLESVGADGLVCRAYPHIRTPFMARNKSKIACHCELPALNCIKNSPWFDCRSAKGKREIEEGAKP